MPEMTHRERVLAAINHQPTDRVPLDYWGVEEFTAKLMNHYGVKDYPALVKAMDLDCIMGVWAPLIKAGRKGEWDIQMRQVPLPDGSGVYEEPVCHPIGGYETIDEIETHYEWPTTDMFDYSNVLKQCRAYHSDGYAVSGGYISLTYFYEMLRGTEQMLLDFASDPELADYVLYKINEFAAAHTKKILEAGEGLIDMTQVTDDFGCQSGLLMSETMIERYLGKYYDSNIAQARAYGAHVYHHDDGAVAGLVPWIVGKGCEILNPLQWHLPGWDLHQLKAEFSSRLCFHGGIDNQLVLPFQGVQEVQAEVRACIDALYSDNTGYILAPCHNVQAITPVENVVAMYQYAKTYGTAK
ncbi:MAG: uroporphyrinogen-III decarboxylase-like protein [Clostridia bacterium]|nr:uroporphyrinogen-III decarboxylase-like protein [Clostridia bacterium]